jgi:hypothetical protein
VYFHPVAGSGWPSVPPNFLAFRWGNAVRQVNRVTEYEIVARLADRFPSVENDESASSRPPEGAHLVYQLGPDIPLPNGAIPSGPPGVNLRAQRFWVLLDQLLTQPTVVDAREASRALGAVSVLPRAHRRRASAAEGADRGAAAKVAARGRPRSPDHAPIDRSVTVLTETVGRRDNRRIHGRSAGTAATAAIAAAPMRPVGRHCR